jgi:hypothetical protein
MDQRCDVCGKLLIPSNKFDERGNEFLCCPQGCDPNQNTWDYDQLCQEIETFDEEITEAYQPSENIYLAAKAIEIQDGEIGNTYQSLFGDYLYESKAIEISEPFIINKRQIKNWSEFLRILIKIGTIKKITLKTKISDNTNNDLSSYFENLKEKLQTKYNVEFDFEFCENLHDRKIKTDTGWLIHLGRGLDIYKFRDIDDECDIEGWDYHFRKCHETTITIVPVDKPLN